MGSKPQVDWQRMFLSPCILAILTLYPAGCKAPGANSSAPKAASAETSAQSLADLKWIDRAARALRLGRGLNQTDPLRQMVQKPKTEVIDLLMKDPLFSHTMVDFYAYYYGIKEDESIAPQFIPQIAYKPETKEIYRSANCQTDPNCSKYLKGSKVGLTFKIVRHPPVFNGALAVANGLSLQSMYQFDQPRHLSLGDLYLILSSFFASDNVEFSPNGVKPAKSELISLPKIEAQFAAAIAKKSGKARELLLEHQKGPNYKSDIIKGFCPKFSVEDRQSDEKILNSFRDLLNFDFIIASCFGNQDLSTEQVSQIIAHYDKAGGLVKKVFGFFEEILTSKATVTDSGVVEVPSSLEIDGTSKIFQQTFWQSHPNSSTNFNRKRAAYVFKTFFCDDLTPVKLEISSDPNDKRHGNDASCAACHYKLDPMAGFFRSFGIAGFKFDNQSQTFVFDDLKVIKGDAIKKYRSSWDFPDRKGPNQGLNIGIVRSATDQSSNSYGTSLEDFGKLIAADRRTYTCTTQRLADYFLGKGNTYDRQWLEDQAEIIASAPRATSGRAVQQVIKNLLLSRTFSEQNPVAGTCYDRSAKVGASSLDCRVASTLDQYCAKCHGPGSDQGGLSLSIWTQALGFAHLDEGGKQRPKRGSYERILTRLGPSEDGPMMPLNSPMPDPDRLVLRQWFEQQISDQK